MNSTIKFGRSYHLKVQGQTQTHDIDFPLTCTFSITRTQFSSLNEGKFSLKGLNQLKQKDIYFDRNVVQSKHVQIDFYAGYTNSISTVLGVRPSLPLVFTGSVRNAYTQRNGAEITTEIEAFDGGFAALNSSADFPYSNGDLYSVAMNKIMQTMVANGVTPGTIKITPAKRLNSDGSITTISVPVAFTDDGVFSGKAIDVLNKYLPDGATAFIDHGVINILGLNDTLITPAAIPVLSSSTGLLGIPNRHFWTVTCSMIFEPRIVVGQMIRLNSTLAPWVNKDTYKITSFSHHGTVSGVESGVAITDLTLQSTAALLV